MACMSLAPDGYGKVRTLPVYQTPPRCSALSDRPLWLIASGASFYPWTPCYLPPCLTGDLALVYPDSWPIVVLPSTPCSNHKTRFVRCCCRKMRANGSELILFRTIDFSTSGRNGQKCRVYQWICAVSPLPAELTFLCKEHHMKVLQQTVCIASEGSNWSTRELF